MSTLDHDSKHQRLHHVPCWEVQPTRSYVRRWNSLVVRPDAYTCTRFSYPVMYLASISVLSLSHPISPSVCVKAQLQPRMTHKQGQLIVLKLCEVAGRTQVPAGPWGDASWQNRVLEDAHKHGSFLGRSTQLMQSLTEHETLIFCGYSYFGTAWTLPSDNIRFN